ncbi:MAG: hypothetical protein COV35_02215 [Alphaproteobacteria bacterium CG11_big_fil_rev_8_21_14_0_20_39_49]|nr:MAG: hypothetical protein COV35_02215 [Alphaproteobacteria bacterium CG11_big_fil_rev_8_21_14_0_20_39_49]
MNHPHISNIIENELIGSQCALCDVTLTSSNDSKEHIIPNSIGGRKKIKGFICQDCNNKYGRTWDLDLAKELNPLALLLNITRERGNSPSQKFKTISGEEVVLNHDGSLNLPKPVFNKERIGDKTLYNFTARSHKEAKEMLANLKKKHPKLDLSTLETVEKSASIDPLHISFTFGSGNTGKSIVKSTLALAKKNGIDAALCKNALNYLRNTDKKDCFGLYYEKDLILNRPEDKVFHCVAISGNSQTGLLLGYVEFFSVQRMVVCLSDEYTGAAIKDIYAIDPLSGEEIYLEFEIPLRKSDMELVYDHKKIPPDSMEEALDTPMRISRQNDVKRELNRIACDTVDYAFEKIRLRGDEALSLDNVEDFTNYALEKLRPFLVKRTSNANE